MMLHIAHLMSISTARRRRWQVSQVVLLLIMLCGATLAACSGEASAPAPPDLHIPGVTKIPGIEQLEQQHGVHVIAGLTTYLSASDHQPHVLFENSPAVYDVRLDGTGLQPTAIACEVLNSVSPNQHWLACKDNSGVAVVDLQTPASTQSDHPAIEDGDGYFVGNPTWAPDNRHLAITSTANGECAIVMYRASADYSTFTMTMVLPLPDFTVAETVGVGCTANQLAWSPDGAWLALMDNGSAYQMYGLPLARLPGHGLADPSPAVTIPIARDQLVPFPHTIGARYAVWSPMPNVLTYVDQRGGAIQEVNVVTGHQTTLLNEQAAGVLALSWTPDGKHLVFVYGRPLTVDVITPPQQIYVYTPSADSSGT